MGLGSLEWLPEEHLAHFIGETWDRVNSIGPATEAKCDYAKPDSSGAKTGAYERCRLPGAHT